MQDQRNRRKQAKGIVVSNKMQNTVAVNIESKIAHPRYKKIVKRTTKVYAHHDNEELNIGDAVTIMETRPLSKLKRWRVVA